MIPESIRAEIEAKGGLLGQPEPQGNGTTIYRAVSGDYVVVDDRTGQPRMRGFSPPSEGVPVQQAPAQPAASAAPATPPGAGGMNQQQLEELLRRVAPNNDPVNRFTFTEGTKEKTIRESDPTAPGGFTSRVIRVPWRKWTDAATAYRVEVDVEPDGSYSLVYNGRDESVRGTPSATTTAQATPQKPQDEVNPNDPTRMRRWNPEANGGKGGFEDAGPNQAEIDRRKKEADAEADKNRPKPEKAPDGTYGYWDTKQTPPKWVPLTGPQAQRTPVEINGHYGVWEPGADGVPVWKPIAAPQAGATAKNVDPFTPDFADPAADLGLGKWAAKQRAKIGLPPEQGGITQKEYDDAASAAHASATTSISNITSNQGVTRQQALDEQSRRDVQAGRAENDLQRKQGVFDAIWKYTTPGSEAIKAWMPDQLLSGPGSARAIRQQYEGDARPMPALHPFFTGGVGAAPATAAPAPSTPTPPNAIGLGGPGAMFSPSGGPALPAPAATPESAVSGAAVAAPAPPSRVLALPTGAVSPPTGVPGYDEPVAPPASSYAPPPLDNVPAPAAETPRVLALPTAVPQYPPDRMPEPQAAPAEDPNERITVRYWSGEPVTVTRGEFNAWPEWKRDQYSAPTTYREAPPLPPGEVTLAPPNPALTTVAQQAGRPVFNPYESAGRMVGLGIPSEAIAQALAEMGMTG